MWSGEERRKNQGSHQVIDLVASKIANSEKSLVDLVAQAAYAAGTSFGGKQMHGLGLFVVASPSTGVVGGLDPAATGNTFWRNQTGTVAMATASNAAGSSGAIPSAMLTAMTTLGISCSRGRDKPDVAVTDATGWTRFAESLLPLQQITNPMQGTAGFRSLKFASHGGEMDVVLDNGYCPAKTMYMLNSDFLYLYYHPDLYFAPLGGERMPVNQDSTIRFYGFMGNMAMSNRARQGILTSTN